MSFMWTLTWFRRLALQSPTPQKNMKPRRRRRLQPRYILQHCFQLASLLSYANFGKWCRCPSIFITSFAGWRAATASRSVTVSNLQRRHCPSISNTIHGRTSSSSSAHTASPIRTGTRRTHGSHIHHSAQVVRTCFPAFDPSELLLPLAVVKAFAATLSKARRQRLRQSAHRYHSISRNSAHLLRPPLDALLHRRWHHRHRRHNMNMILARCQCR